jgi:hypothetical protein
MVTVQYRIIIAFPHRVFVEALEHIKTMEEVDISSTIWCTELSASEF